MDKAPEAFRTISEVADELEVPKHVLRFWEAKFAQLKPMKRGGGRRYYRPEDVQLLRGIRFLLYNDGYTIRGVQKILREHGPRFVMDYRRMGEDEEQDDAMPENPRCRRRGRAKRGTSPGPRAQRATGEARPENAQHPDRGDRRLHPGAHPSQGIASPRRLMACFDGLTVYIQGSPEIGFGA